MWQKCPICLGTGKINSFSSTVFQLDCEVCNGKKIISELTGLPPGPKKTLPVQVSDSPPVTMSKGFLSYEEIALNQSL